MSETVRTAREKYECPACGAEAHWNPAKQVLACAFCGTQSPATLETRGADTIIVEHDLAAALREIPDDARGWQTSKTSVRCQSCEAISVFDPDKIGKRCDFCGSTQLAPYVEVKEAFRPESLLVMKLRESQARDLIREWYRKQWLAPNRLRTHAMTDTAKGVYLPYWTFDAGAHADWTADAGDYYYTHEKGKRVRHIRWRAVSGQLTHVFDDQLVPASKGVHAKWLRAVEPFPTQTLVPYDAAYLAGWTVERYQIDLVNAAARSREQMEAELRRLCASRVPGDTHRNLVVRSTFSDQRFKHILLPVWLMTYTFGANTYQVVINAVTGSVAGGRPWSWIKIALLIFFVLVLIYLGARFAE